MGDYQRELWYIGKISRAVTNELLQGKEPGLYLVRDSSTCKGDFVLCVSENNRVSNYIIKSKPDGTYDIGENTFNNLQMVIQFYTEHALDTTTLNRVVVTQRVRGRYDLAGRDAEDLPFKRGEILYVIAKPEEQWWDAVNQNGQIGSIPAPYITPEDTAPPPKPSPQQHQAAPVPVATPVAPPQIAQPMPPPLTSLPPVMNTGPVNAVAIMDRIPSAYDQKSLSFKAGDFIKVTKQNENGLWEGESNGRFGVFPFNHVRVTD